MSVNNAVKALEEEKKLLERELNKISKALEALNGSGMTRKRKSIPKSENQKNIKRIISLLQAQPGLDVNQIMKMLEFSSQSYTYDKLRELIQHNVIRVEKTNRKTYGKYYLNTSRS
jgi:predicted transcriptional regulator